MSKRKNPNKTDAKKRNVEEVHLGELNCDEICRNIENHDFVKLCNKTSTKRFENKILKASNDVFQQSKIVLSIFVFVLNF